VDVVSNCLVFDPRQRLSASELLKLIPDSQDNSSSSSSSSSSSFNNNNK
jgi:hypothetical protein